MKTRTETTLLMGLFAVILVFLAVVAYVATRPSAVPKAPHPRTAFALGSSIAITLRSGAVPLTVYDYGLTHFSIYRQRHPVCGQPTGPEVHATAYVGHASEWIQRDQYCLLVEANPHLLQSYPTPVVAPTVQPVALPTSPPATAVSVPSGGSCGPGDTAACAQYLLGTINAERTAHGYTPLALSAILSNGSGTCIGAIGHALHMAAVGTISHDQFPSDICGAYLYAGENVGVGATGTMLGDLKMVHSQMALEPWSPGCGGNHHCNWMSPSFHQIGIGIAQGAYSSWAATYLSEEFTN